MVGAPTRAHGPLYSRAARGPRLEVAEEDSPSAGVRYPRQERPGYLHEGAASAAHPSTHGVQLPASTHSGCRCHPDAGGRL